MSFYTEEKINSYKKATEQLLKDRKVKDCEVYIKKADDRDDYITVESGYRVIGIFGAGDFRMLESTLNLLKNKDSSYATDLMLEDSK